MKSFVSKFMLGLILLAALTGPAWGQTRIATINLRKVFDTYWKKKDAEAALKEQETDIQKDFKAMTTEFEKAKDEYQKLLVSANDPAVSAEEREKRKKTAEEKLKKLKESDDRIKAFGRDADENIKERRKRVRENLLNDITNILIAKAKAGGYSMVIDSEAETINGTKVLLYSEPNSENDLTKAVLDDLNRGAPSETTSEKKEDKKEEKKDDKKKGAQK